MGDFFNGWRRKFGLQILVIALVFMGGWVRGHTTWNAIRFGHKGGHEFYSLESSHFGLMWIRFDFSDVGDAPFSGQTTWQQLPIESFGGLKPIENLVPPHTIKWRWQSCGFDFGE